MMKALSVFWTQTKVQRSNTTTGHWKPSFYHPSFVKQNFLHWKTNKTQLKLDWTPWMWRRPLTQPFHYFCLFFVFTFVNHSILPSSLTISSRLVYENIVRTSKIIMIISRQILESRLLFQTGGGAELNLLHPYVEVGRASKENKD